MTPAPLKGTRVAASPPLQSSFLHGHTRAAEHEEGGAEDRIRSENPSDHRVEIILLLLSLMPFTACLLVSSTAAAAASFTSKGPLKERIHQRQLRGDHSIPGGSLTGSVEGIIYLVIRFNGLINHECGPFLLLRPANGSHSQVGGREKLLLFRA